MSMWRVPNAPVRSSKQQIAMRTSRTSKMLVAGCLMGAGKMPPISVTAQ